MGILNEIAVNGVKSLLEAKLREITLRSGDTKDGLKVEVSADQLDRASNETDRMTSAGMGERDRGLVFAIQEALGRIEEGGYGVCARCDEPIAPRRLELVPWASYCVVCQDYLERTSSPKVKVSRLSDHGQSLESEARARLGEAYIEDEIRRR